MANVFSITGQILNILGLVGHMLSLSQILYIFLQPLKNVKIVPSLWVFKNKPQAGHNLWTIMGQTLEMENLNNIFDKTI